MCSLLLTRYNNLACFGHLVVVFKNRFCLCLRLTQNSVIRFSLDKLWVRRKKIPWKSPVLPSVLQEYSLWLREPLTKICAFTCRLQLPPPLKLASREVLCLSSDLGLLLLVLLITTLRTALVPESKALGFSPVRRSGFPGTTSISHIGPHTRTIKLNKADAWNYILGDRWNYYPEYPGFRTASSLKNYDHLNSCHPIWVTCTLNALWSVAAIFETIRYELFSL